MQAAQIIIPLFLLCLSTIYPVAAWTSPDNTNTIFYRQHMQGKCEIIEDQSLDEDDEDDDNDDYQDEDCFLEANTKQELSDYGLMTLAYHSPRGIGYDRGYFSLGFSHVIKAKTTGFFSVADWRFHVLSSGRFALNLGAGARYIDSSLTQALGFFAYYDFRTTHIKNYHQAGLSLEWLTTCFDVRLNGYYPIGDPKSRTSHYIKDKSAPSSLVINTYNYSYTRLEAEIGKSFETGTVCDFYTGVQGYYLKSREKASNKKEAFGARLRLTTVAQDRPSLELIGSYDPIFKARAQFVCSVPLSYETSLISALTGLCSPELLHKIGALPVRDDLIVLKSKHYKTYTRNPRGPL